MRYLTILAYAAAFLSAGSITALAAPSCTNWMNQGDGTSWRECVDDQGHQHCYKISNTPGSVQYEVKC